MDFNTVTEIVLTDARPAGRRVARRRCVAGRRGSWIFSEEQPAIKRLIDLKPLGGTRLMPPLRVWR